MQATSTERWLPIPGYPKYEVSDLGRVRSWHPWRGQEVPRHLHLSDWGGGYVGVALYVNGRSSTKRLHNLVMLAFRGPRPSGLVTRHIDGNPANTVLGNLTYGTYSENELDAVALGTHVQARKTHCPRGHEYDYLDNTGGRRCRTCDRERHRRRYRIRRRVASAQR